MPDALAAESAEGFRRGSGSLLGRSPALRRLREKICRVAPLDVPVLITGESGTGKELAARALHAQSPRADKPLVVVCCSAVAETLLDSELFGHEKGAFTGADRRRPGKIEMANGGTPFLDEVGEMILAMQAKLLRALEYRQVDPVGGGRPVPVDFRLVAATNRDLRRLIAEGLFRHELFYRLTPYQLHLPPLRERADDIPLLVDHYLRYHCAKLNLPVPAIAAETMRILAAHSWPGNVRELENVLCQAVVDNRGPLIGPESLPAELCGPAALPPFDVEGSVAALLEAGAPDIYKTVHRRLDKPLLEAVLRHTQGNEHRAAELLGMSRSTLRKKRKELDINRPEAGPSPP